MGSVVKELCESWQAVECWVLTCCCWPEVVDRLLLFRFVLSRITAIFKNDNGAPKIVMVSKVDVMIEETKATGSSNSTDQAFLRDMQQLSGGSNNSSNSSNNHNHHNSSSSVFAQELNATTLDGVDPATREMLVRWSFMALVWTFWTVFFSFDMSLTTSSCFIISLFSWCILYVADSNPSCWRKKNTKNNDGKKRCKLPTPKSPTPRRLVLNQI